MKRFQNPVPQFFKDDGSICSAGKMYFYENGGTSSLKDTYSDELGTIPNTNPVLLSSEGRVSTIYGDGLYTIVLKDSDGVQVWRRDNVDFSNEQSQFDEWSSAINYDLNQIVRYGGSYYISDQVNNYGNAPDISGGYWSVLAFFTYFNADKLNGYSLNDVVIYSGRLYRSKSNLNVGDVTDLAYWENLSFNNYIDDNLTVVGTVASASFLKAIKSSSQTVASSITLVDVTDMSLPLVNGITYHVRAHISWRAGLTTANGIKVTFSGAAHYSFMWIANTNASTANATPTANASGGSLQFTKMPNSAANSDEVIIFDAIVTGLGTAYVMQFAQAVSDAIPTQINSKTFITATRLN